MHKGWQYIALILLFCLPVIAAVVASDYSMLCSLVQRDGDPALAEMAVQEAEAELGEDHGKTIVPVIITYKKKRKNFFNWYNLN